MEQVSVAPSVDPDLLPISIPNHPDRAIKTAPPGTPVLYHTPGTDLPGLDYDFELVFNDTSTLFDWTVRDFPGCYDALRAYLGTGPEETGLTRLEFRLIDHAKWTPDPLGWYLQESNLFSFPLAGLCTT